MLCLFWGTLFPLTEGAASAQSSEVIRWLLCLIMADGKVVPVAAIPGASPSPPVAGVQSPVMEIFNV